MTEVEQLKAQIETMVAVMQQLSAQVEKLMSTPPSSRTPTTPAPAMPAPAPTTQPQPQQQAGQQDPWLGSWQRYQVGNIATAQPGTTAPPPTAQPGTTAPPAPLQPINPKDVEMPEKYDSTGDGWLEWAKTFVRFLDRNDAP